MRSLHPMSETMILTLKALLGLLGLAANAQPTLAPNSWSIGTPMPTARQGPFTGVIGTNIYVVGGITNTSVLNVNEIYDTTTNTWSSGAPMPTARWLAASAVVNNILYTIGGRSSSNVSLNVVEAYDPATNTWSTKSPMPIANDNIYATVENNIIYVIGGFSQSSQQRITTVLSYNPATDVWSVLAPLNVGKSESAVGLLGSTIISAGGLTNSSATTTDTEGYNAATNSWTTLASMPTARQAACFGVTSGLLYVAGGSSAGGAASVPLTVMEAYDATTNSWSSGLPSIPNAVVSPGSVSVGDRLYCFGGSSNGVAGQGTVNDYVQIYQPATTACLAPPSGLVGWWPGDTNENDIVGGNNASVVSLVTLVPAEVKDGFQFASRGYVTIPESPILENQRFTWVAWVRPDGPSAISSNNDRNGSVIVNQVYLLAENVFTQLSWSSSSGQFVFVFGDDSTEFILSQHSFAPGVFYSVAGTYDGSTFRLFVNGVLEGSLSDAKTILYSSLGWQFGGNASFAVNFPRTWNGVIDEVQAFNRALSADQLLSIFNAGSAGECKNIPPLSVNSFGTVNNASFAPGSTPLAPGTIAAVFGTGLDDGSMDAFSSFGADGKLINSLGGASVTFSGVSNPVPIFSAFPQQLNIEIPQELAGLTSATIQVTVNGQTSAPQFVPLGAFSPGIFTIPPGGTGQGAIQIANSNPVTFAAPQGSIPGSLARPANIGEFITIFCTGLGAVTNTPATGAPASGTAPSTTLATPEVTIGGVPVTVSFSGLAPTFVGLYQVNVQVPSGVPQGDAVPLSLSIAGVKANVVTVAIAGS
jgi:uncharacterized protein (TIGR03437 family)